MADESVLDLTGELIGSEQESLRPNVIPYSPLKAIDLTKEDGQTTNRQSNRLNGIASVGRELRRDLAREDFTKRLLWILFAALLGIFALAFRGQIDSSVLVEGVFPSLVTLVGTALGFYFGSKQEQLAEENSRDRARPTKNKDDKESES